MTNSDLKEYHFNLLRHIKNSFGIYGWESYTDTIRELEELGLIIGKWIGTIELPPRPHWTITSLGEKLISNDR